jgi:NAD(P)-dependent dehydrogenase (short-subunit alcohol dehydrogenase family)
VTIHLSPGEDAAGEVAQPMTDTSRRLTGRAAIVLGGGRGDEPGPAVGIGFATAATFARHGAAVAVVDRDANAARRTVDLVRRNGGTACAIVADVTDPDQVERAVAETLRAFGHLDVVHNNVGATRLGGPEELALDEWRATLAVNLDSVFISAQKTIPHLLERGGSIINVSSTASIRWTGYPYPAYSAAKAAVNQLTRMLAVQYAGRGIRVNAILPGLIDTPLVYRQLSAGRSPADVRAERAARSPTGAMGSAYDVAHAALFLASDESAYITGALLPVDGGLHARAG